MGADTRIEWADFSFNPWSGCAKVSPACDHCYAEAQAKRAPKTFGGWGPHAERKRTSESYWRQPLKWNSEARKAGTRPRVFCASMADIMDKAAPIEWFVDALDLIRITPTLIWMLLTKRPQMIRARLEAALAHLAQGIDRGDLIEWIALWLDGHPPENVWLGTTVENQAEADRRIPHLLAAPAAKRFLSMEPLLGPVDLTRLGSLDVLRATMLSVVTVTEREARPSTVSGMQIDALHGAHQATIFHQTPDHMGGFAIRFPRPFPRLDWVIAGGESGPHARPSHPDWFRSLRDQCQAARVPYFHKQNGEWVSVSEVEGAGPHHHFPDGATVRRVGKKAAGASLDGREWREVPHG